MLPDLVAYIAGIVGDYGRFLKAQSRDAEAAAVYRQAVEIISSELKLAGSESNKRYLAERLASCFDLMDQHDEAAKIRRQYRLLDPSTQPAATQPTTAPATQPVSAEQDAEIRAFVAQLEKEFRDRTESTSKPATTAPAR